MNGDREMPTTTEEVWESVYSGMEGLGSVISAQQATIERQSANISAVAEGLARRPTRKETGGFLALVFLVAVLAFAAVVSAVFFKLQDGQEVTERQLEQVQRLSEENRRLNARSDPCLPDDPPTTEQCKRKAATDAFVAQVLADFGAEAERQHNQLLTELGRRPVVTSTPTRRTPTTRPTSPTTAPAPPTTTTTAAPRPCGLLGVGTCRGG